MRDWNLSSSHQHLMTEAPAAVDRDKPGTPTRGGATTYGGRHRRRATRATCRTPNAVSAAERGVNNLRALARNRGETGSLGTAPSATQSCRCSHSGIAPGLTAVFSLYVGRFRRSREKRRRNEGRPRRGGSRSAGDRLASRVSWSGVGRSRDTRPRKADGGSDLRPAECCRPGESARGMDPSCIPRMSRIKFLIGLAEGLLGGVTKCGARLGRRR